MAVLRFGSSHFRLNPFAIAITLLAIGLMIKLGMWQIDRGQEKQRLIDQHLSATAEGSRNLTEYSLSALATQPDQPIEGRVSLDPHRYFLVENQIHEGRVGYHVIALAHTEPFTAWIPVNLGWVPAAASRATDPHIELPGEITPLKGRVHLPQPPFLLQQQSWSDNWPVRIQYPELELMNTHIGGNLAPFLWRIEEGAEAANPQGTRYIREWPVVSMEPHRHYAYAVQWFGLALAAAVVFFVASRRRNDSVQAEDKNKDVA